VPTLVLLRHAKSAWPGVPDQDRPLAGRGRRDAPAAGRWLRAAGLLPDLVVCSTAKRARQTWWLAAAELTGPGQNDDGPAVVFEPRVYEASPAGLLGLVREVPDSVRTLLLVGHEPGMSGLALTLGGSAVPSEALDRVRAKFPTSAIAVLSFTGAWSGLGPGGARLIRFVTPGGMRDGRD
jgi:phosphohistidine phosphatase